MKQQLSKNLQLSQSVFTHLSSRSVLAVMTGTKREGGGDHSLSRSIRVSIEILIWSCSPAVSLSKAVCERASVVVYPTENQGELINPSKTAPWNMNDSCRVPGDRRKELWSPGQSPLQPIAQITKSMERERWFKRVKYALSHSDKVEKDPMWLENERTIDRDREVKRAL